VLAIALDDQGYAVLQAATGYEAVGMLADSWVDLLVTDVRMPGIDGFELAPQAKVMRPTISVLYLSGHSTDDGGLKYGELLQKPVRLAELLRAVDKLLT
jgi:DNA-binding response OmpR family regulator